MVTKPEKESVLPKLTLLQRMNLVMNEVDYVQKEKKAGMKYSIVSHDVVTAKVRPLLVKHGIVYYPVRIEMSQVGNRTQMLTTVRFVSIDDPADFIDVATAGYGIDEQDKGPGKAISYSVKYALLKALGLESGDDPDEDQTSEHVDPSDPDIIAIEEFKLAIEVAADEPALMAAGEKHSAKMGSAAAKYPAKVQAVRSAFKARLAAMRKAGATRNDEDKQ